MLRLKRRNRIALISLLGGGLIASLLVANAFGAVNISILDILKMVVNKLTAIYLENS
jgi:hypothetical protein